MQQQILFYIGFIALVLLPISFACSLVLGFWFGNEPLQNNQYKILGALHALSAVLFSTLSIVEIFLTGNARGTATWIGFVLSAIFAYLSYDKFKKTR